MGKRDPYHKPVSRAYHVWGRQYPRFPGLAECIRQIRECSEKGKRAEVIVNELADHVPAAELIEAFYAHPEEKVQLCILRSFDITSHAEAVPLLAEVLRGGNPLFVPIAERTLRHIDTPASRAALRGDDPSD